MTGRTQSLDSKTNKEKPLLEKSLRQGFIMKGGKWYLQESNRGHTDFQSDALPTELRHQQCVKDRFCSFAGAKVQRKIESAKLFCDFFRKMADFVDSLAV